MGYFGPSPLECYLWSACLPETIVPRPTNLIVLIGIRLGASLPIRPDRRTSIELVVFCSLTLSKYFSPGLQPLAAVLFLSSCVALNEMIGEGDGAPEMLFAAGSTIIPK